MTDDIFSQTENTFYMEKVYEENLGNQEIIFHLLFF